MVLASSKTMDALKAIGLNKYQRNLWAALLARAASTAGELSDISNVPRSRCYDVLQSLAEWGFIIIQPGKPMKYVAVPPGEALERAKKKVHERAHEISDKIEKIRKSDILRELEKLHKDSMKVVQPEEMAGTLKGRYAMHQQFETMFKNARKSIKLMTSSDGLNEIVEHHLLMLKKAAENGVSIKIVAPVGKEVGEQASMLAKYAQLRDIGSSEGLEKLNGRLAVVDGQEFLISLTDDAKTHPTQDVAFWTQSTHASSKFLEPVFEMMWKGAKPVR